MVQLHQREWRVGEAPCSLFSDTHSSGKIQPFWFLLHRLLWRGVIHSTSTYMNSLSLSQDSTSLTLLFAPVSSEILQTRLPSSLGQYKTIPFSFPFSTWCTLRLPWFRLNVLSYGSRSFQGSWSKDTVGGYFCPSLLHRNLVCYPEHNRHPIIALKQKNEQMNEYTCICQSPVPSLIVWRVCSCVQWGRGVGMGIGEKERLFLLLFLEGDAQKWWGLRTSEQTWN